MPNIYPAIDPLLSLATLGYCCYICQALQTLCHIYMDFSTLSSKQYSKGNNIKFLEKLVLHYQREVDRQVYNLHVNISFGGQVL